MIMEIDKFDEKFAEIAENTGIADLCRKNAAAEALQEMWYEIKQYIFYDEPAEENRKIEMLQDIIKKDDEYKRISAEIELLEEKKKMLYDKQAERVTEIADSFYER